MIFPGQASDQSGLQAMTPLIPAVTNSGGTQGTFFMLPLPPRTGSSIRLLDVQIPGRARETAVDRTGRSGRPLRVSGIQHAPPTLICSVNRTEQASRSAPLTRPPELATDLRWAAGRLDQAGPAAPYVDLTLVDTPRAERLRRLLGQTAHLLAPTDPPHSLIDILCSRVSHDPDWGPQARTLTASRRLPALSNAWPPPDLPEPALRRILTGHDDDVTAVAISPDGTWLATTSLDGTARVWDAATGRCRTIITGHGWAMTAVAISPDGTWLATTSHDGTARVWDAATWKCRATLIGPGNWVAAVTGHGWAMTAVAISPDGTWLATTSHDGTARVLDATTSSKDRAVLIWEPATRWSRTIRTTHGKRVTAVAIAPDGTWLATGSQDRTVRIWDAAVGRITAVLRVDSPLRDCAWSPSGRLLAVAGDSGFYLFAFNS